VTLSNLLIADLELIAANYPSIDIRVVIFEQERILKQIECSNRSRSLTLIKKALELKPVRSKLELTGPEVSFQSETSSQFTESLLATLRDLIPWRKGPFNLFGQHLDAEWRSELKFSRLGLNNLANKKVADLGAGNGYYMLKMLGLNPELVLGFDPTNRYLVQYYLLRSFLPPDSKLGFILERDSILQKFESFFDVILCLGVLYHHPVPEELLENIFFASAPGSEIYLETLYAKNETIRLDGRERYARMKNVYLVPTLELLEEMLSNAGFRQLEIISKVETSEEEQRCTRFAPGESLVDFIDKSDSERTVEGHPRPQRVIFKGVRPFD